MWAFLVDSLDPTREFLTRDQTKDSACQGGFDLREVLHVQKPDEGLETIPLGAAVLPTGNSRDAGGRLNDDKSPQVV